MVAVKMPKGGEGRAIQGGPPQVNNPACFGANIELKMRLGHRVSVGSAEEEKKRADRMARFGIKEILQERAE